MPKPEVGAMAVELGKHKDRKGIDSSGLPIPPSVSIDLSACQVNRRVLSFGAEELLTRVRTSQRRELFCVDKKKKSALAHHHYTTTNTDNGCAQNNFRLGVFWFLVFVDRNNVSRQVSRGCYLCDGSFGSRTRCRA